MFKSQSPLPNKKKVKLEMSFPHALEVVIGGGKVRRLEWADQKEHLVLKDEYLKVYRIKTGETKYGFHALLVTEGDLMAIDWVSVSGN